jgi:hypothetical protein
LDLPGVSAGKLRKRVRLTAEGLLWELAFDVTVTTSFLAGWEFSLAFAAPDAGPDYPSRAAAWEAEPKNEWALVDGVGGWRARLVTEPAFRLWHAPLYTVSCSESGYEKNYQGSAFYLWTTWTPAQTAGVWRAALTLS